MTVCQVSLVLHSLLPSGAMQGWDLSDLTPRRHQHLGFISDQAHVAACGQGVLAFCLSRWREKLLLFFFSPPDLPAFHLPPCCSSIFGGLAASGDGGGGGVLSSLTNVLQIALQDDDGGRPRSGPYLFFLATLTLSVCPSLLCLGGPVKWKNSCLTSF